MLLDKYNWG